VSFECFRTFPFLDKHKNIRPKFGLEITKPIGVRGGGIFDASASAKTFGMFAWASLRNASRIPGFAVMMAITWIIEFAPLFACGTVDYCFLSLTPGPSPFSSMNVTLSIPRHRMDRGKLHKPVAGIT
jgi:hypothetical protein